MCPALHTCAPAAAARGPERGRARQNNAGSCAAPRPRHRLTCQAALVGVHGSVVVTGGVPGVAVLGGGCPSCLLAAAAHGSLLIVWSFAHSCMGKGGWAGWPAHAARARGTSYQAGQHTTAVGGEQQLWHWPDRSARVVCGACAAGARSAWTTHWVWFFPFAYSSSTAPTRWPHWEWPPCFPCRGWYYPSQLHRRWQRLWWLMQHPPTRTACACPAGTRPAAHLPLRVVALQARLRSSRGPSAAAQPGAAHPPHACLWRSSQGHR